MNPACFASAGGVSHDTEAFRGAADHIVIRGQSLPLDGLIRHDIGDPALIAAQRAAFSAAEPFEHITIDGLFHERLLELLIEEFDTSQWRKVESRRETTYRSATAKALGAATQVYINLVNSPVFTEYLSAITGVDNLITDHNALWGGLHETRPGGHFGIHRDFNYHRDTLLANRLVLITYLNRDWRDDFGGALELWDHKRKACVKSVAPMFGRTILFRHSERSFHGQPAPLLAPAGRTRRSVAAYYYVNEHSDVIMPFWRTSTFLDRTLTSRQKAKMMVRNIVPPALWMAAKGIRDIGRNWNRPG